MSEKLDIMEEIRESNRAVTTGIDEKDIKYWVEIYIMGKAYKVPAGLTIMQAVEYAGYLFMRSCGCRAGFCGACSTVYRLKGKYKLCTAMACQTRVEDGMFLVQIPFAPSDKPIFNIEIDKAEPSIFLKYFPEIARCVSCNTCAKACPQNLQVMDYIQAALRGDFESVAEESFDCIQCGLCAMRCPAEIVHYHVGQLGRRIYGKYIATRDPNLDKRIDEISSGRYKEELDRLMSSSDIRRLYAERKREPD